MANEHYDPDVLKAICEKIDLLEYAKSQGIQFTQKSGDWWCSCPRHVDKTPSLRIRGNNHTDYRCFSCESFGDAIQFFRDMEGLSFKKAVEKAAKLANVDAAAMSPSPMVTFMKRMGRKKETPATEHKIISESELEDIKVGDVEAWREEGIEQWVLDKFEVGVNAAKTRISYPIRDENGNLINIKSRTLYENYRAMKIPKYSNRFPIGKISYFEGLNVTRPYVEQSGELILFESIKSVMKCFGWGIKNTAAVGNHGLTDDQIRLILRLGVPRVVVAYDKDVTVWKDKKLYATLTKLSRFCNLSVIYDRSGLLGEKESPADRGKQVFRTLYAERRKLN